MADTILATHVATNYSASASTTSSRFTSLTTGYTTTNSSGLTEALHTSAFDAAGTISLLTLIVSANTYSISKTVVLRINGADGNSSITVGAGVTGQFQDAINSDAIAAGDDVCLRLAPNFQLQAWTLQSVSCKFAATGATANVWAAAQFVTGETINHGNASTTRYIPLRGVGDLNGFFNATESNARKKVKTAGTFSRLQTYLTTNSLTNNATIRFRTDGANGNQTLTILAGVTGLYEDTVNTDAVVVGNDVNASCTTGAGTVSGTMGSLSSAFTSGATGWDMRWAATRTASYSFTVGANYLSFSGDRSTGTTEATLQTRLPRQCYAHKLVARITANSGGSGSTIALRDDGADTALTLTIPVNTTGDFEDGSNVVSIAADSLVNYRLTAGVSSIVPQYVGITLDTVDPEGGDVVLRPVVSC